VNSNFTSNSRLVPDPAFDHDGYFNWGGGSALQYGYLEKVKGRASLVCRFTGTTAERVADCASVNGAKAVWEGAGYGQSGEGDWKLVALYSSRGTGQGGSC